MRTSCFTSKVISKIMSQLFPRTDLDHKPHKNTFLLINQGLGDDDIHHVIFFKYYGPFERPFLEGIMKKKPSVVCELWEPLEPNQFQAI